MRDLLFCLFLLAASFTYGCAANPSTAPILTDRIYAVSSVDPEGAKVVGVNYPRPIAVLGEKHTYIVGAGSDDIVKLANTKGKAILKDGKTLYLEGGKFSGLISYEVVGFYSTAFQVSGVVLPAAPLNGVDLQRSGRIVNFYRGPKAIQEAPHTENAMVTIVKAPVLTGAFLLWTTVDLATVATGGH